MNDVSLGFAVKGLQEIIEANKSFDALRKLAKQTDMGVKGLSGTLASYRKNLVKVNAAQKEAADAKNKILNMKNLIFNDAIAASLKAAISFEVSMADISRVVKFANKAEKNLYAQQIKDLTDIIPMQVEHIAAITATGGALGIQKDELLKFTQNVAKASFAFNMDTGAASETMAAIMNVYQIGVDEARELTDAINKVSGTVNVKAKDMMETMAGIGENAKVFKLTGEQAAALAGSFLSLSKSPKIAETAINALLSKLQTAPKQGKEFQDTLKQLGIDADTLADSIKADPQAALDSFLERLNNADKDEQAEIFKNLMGESYSGNMAPLVGSLTQYRKALDGVSEKEKYLNSLEEDFAEKTKGTTAQIIFMQNSLNRVAIEFGSIFLPLFNDFLKLIRSIANPLAKFIQQHETLVKVVTEAIGVLIGIRFVYQVFRLVFFTGKMYIIDFINILDFLKIALIFSHAKLKAFIFGIDLASLRLKVAIVATYLYGRAVSFLKMAFTGLIGGFKAAIIGIRTFDIALFAASLRLKVAIAGMYLCGSAVLFLKLAFVGLLAGLNVVMIGIRAFSIALFTTPLGWIILAITAVVTAVVMLYKKFEWFRDFIGKVWEIIKTIFSWSPLGLLMKGIGVALDWLGEKFEWIGDIIEFFGNLWDGIKNVFSSVIDWFFGDNKEVELNKEEADIYNENSPVYDCGEKYYTPVIGQRCDTPAMSAQTAGGCAITINFNGNLAIGSRMDGTFDFNQFKQELVKAVKDALSKDTQNAANRRID
ncbi:MAG: phage tail tape measure protein [Campylobacteraceae bacterium]|jgi:TP901 family phage tail tape measure protein|nr:phage tail tape measure protein [Campylobacteraceae bacterium]